MTTRTVGHTQKAERVNVQGLDSDGNLIVKVANPVPMDAVRRARLYEAANDLRSALEAIVDEAWSVTQDDEETDIHHRATIDSREYRQAKAALAKASA